MTTMIRASTICILVMMTAAPTLTACGQKGPLYLPEPPKRVDRSDSVSKPSSADKARTVPGTSDIRK